MRGNTLKPLDMAQAIYLVAMWTVILFLTITAAQAGQVNLAWNASSGATGYQVHYGTTSGNYPNNVNASNTTTTTVADLADGATYYFAVKAYDSSGNESVFSNEVSATLPAVAPAPVASFSADQTSGAAPLTVKFTDQSTGSVTGWCWKFGITTTNTCDSTVQNPDSQTYSTAKTYTVSLVVTGPGGTSPATTQTITVNAPTTTAPVPDLKFTLNPATGQVPVMVTFTGTWTGDATKWTLSGSSPFVGSSGTTQPATAIQSYSTPGPYDVTFTVTGADGKNYAVTKTITATTVAPTADFTASATSGAAPLTVQFTDTSTPTGAITGWSWNFGDVSTSISTSNPNTSTAQNPQHTYGTPGTYQVRLEATNSQGTTSKTASITVTEASASTDGLVAAYNFEEASGDTVVDASGNGNHGAISGAKRINSGKFGRALSFDGVDDWVTVNDSNSLDLTNGMTLQAWVYPTELSGWRTVLIKEESGTSGIYSLYANTDYFGSNQPAAVLDTHGEQVVAGGTQLPLKKWTHLAVTYDGQYQRLYVGGTQVAMQPQTGSILNDTGALRMGGSNAWGYYFKGRIDEIRIYNRALSAAEISTDMNTEVAKSSPPKRLLGEEALGSVSDSLPQGTAAAFQTTASVNGMITSLPVYVDTGSASTKLVVGLYADSNGRPGTRLATGTLNSPKAGSWNTVLLPATQVTAGTKYWIAILSPSGELKFRDKVGGAAQPSETSKRTSLTSLPSTWATGTVSANGPLSGYGAGY